MRTSRRGLTVVSVLNAAIAAAILAIVASADTIHAAERQAAGQWVDPANPSDQLITGPYRVDPNWRNRSAFWLDSLLPCCTDITSSIGAR